MHGELAPRTQMAEVAETDNKSYPCVAGDACEEPRESLLLCLVASLPQWGFCGKILGPIDSGFILLLCFLPWLSPSRQ